MVSFSCEVSRKSPCLVPKSPQTALAKAFVRPASASRHLTVCFFATGFRSTRCFSPSILNVTPLPVWPHRLHTPPCPEAARSAILTDITHTFPHTTSTGPRPTGQCPLHPFSPTPPRVIRLIIRLVSCLPSSTCCHEPYQPQSLSSLVLPQTSNCVLDSASSNHRLFNLVVVRRRLDQEEARPSSQPLSRCHLFLHRLHGSLPRH